MTRNAIILGVSLLVLLFSLDSLTSSQPPEESPAAPTDTTFDLVVAFSTVYPGTDNHLLQVLMKNPYDYSMGFDLMVGIGDPSIGHFSTDESGHCIVDTTGCLASYTMMGPCLCLKDDCSFIQQAAMILEGHPRIPPSANWRCLFKINMDACCVPDSASIREAFIPISGVVYNGEGEAVPFRYHYSSVMLWWSVPGDANGDSAVTGADVTFIINYLYKSGPEPCVCEAADCNADNSITGADIVYLINYLYQSGPAPLPGVYACWHFDCRPEE